MVPGPTRVGSPDAGREAVEYQPTPADCTNCEGFLQILSKTGCQMACDVLKPEMRPVCQKILTQKTCAELFQWLSKEGLSPQRICQDVGLCPKAIAE